MCQPIAIIQFPADFQYDGAYEYNGDNYLGYRRAGVKFRVSGNALAKFRAAGQVRFIRFSRAGSTGWGFLNHEGDLAAVAAIYNRSQSERYKQAERQQAPNGEWYLSPRAFERFVGVGATTRDTWRKNGVPILEGDALDTHDFPDGNGMLTPFYSEKQAKGIVEARAATDGALTLASKAAKKCRVDVCLVSKLAHDGVIEAELRPTRIGSRTFRAWWVSVPNLRRELLRRGHARRTPRAITDAISSEKAAQLIGRHPATIRKLVRRGKIKGEYLGHEHQGGRRLVVSRDSALTYQASCDKALSLSGEEPWIGKRRIRAQYPDLSWDILRPYLYDERTVPPLGRSVGVRFVKRPPGLKCPHKKVREFWAEDVRVLVEWVKTPRAPAGPSPRVQRTLAFLKTYLAGGRSCPKQDIIAAAAEKGIKKQWLNEAIPYLEDLVRENDGTRGKGRFTRWRLEQLNAAKSNGHTSKSSAEEPNPLAQANGTSPQPANAGVHINPEPKRRGRPKGRDPEVIRREKAMLAAWDRGEFGTNKAAAGRAFKFHRQDATKLINAHERKKCKKQFAQKKPCQG
jgi:hypothetical protein